MKVNGMFNQATDMEEAIKYGAMAVYTKVIGKEIKQMVVDV